MAAFLFDRAVARFGSAVEADQREAAQGKDGKRAQMAANMVLVRWLGEEFTGGFRTPVATK